MGILLTQVSFAQNYVHQVLVLNEGYFDYTTNQSVVPPTIGSYDPVTQTYTTIDTIQSARFGSDLIIDGDYFYVAADNHLYKYNKNIKYIFIQKLTLILQKSTHKSLRERSFLLAPRLGRI